MRAPSQERRSAERAAVRMGVDRLSAGGTGARGRRAGLTGAVRLRHFDLPRFAMAPKAVRHLISRKPQVFRVAFGTGYIDFRKWL